MEADLLSTPTASFAFRVCLLNSQNSQAPFPSFPSCFPSFLLHSLLSSLLLVVSALFVLFYWRQVSHIAQAGYQLRAAEITLDF